MQLFCSRLGDVYVRAVQLKSSSKELQQRAARAPASGESPCDRCAVSMLHRNGCGAVVRVGGEAWELEGRCRSPAWRVMSCVEQLLSALPSAKLLDGGQRREVTL